MCVGPIDVEGCYLWRKTENIVWLPLQVVKKPSDCKPTKTLKMC
jgi:hypothetical protein